MSLAVALPRTPSAAARPGIGAVYRWELEKLAARLPVRLLLGACAAAPPLFVVLLRLQASVPKDTLFGRWVHESGFAVPLVVLGFAGQWVLPLVASLVAGDIFAGEDRQGTWETLLTRSASRAKIFLAKVLAAITVPVLAVTILALFSLASGVVLIGAQPLIGLSGTLLSPGASAVLVAESWASALPPMLAFTALALLLSVLSRSTAIGVAAPVVIGAAMVLASLIGGIDGLRHLLLTTPYESWHGLFTVPRFYRPLVRGAVVSAVYAAAFLCGAWLAFRRRDIAGD